jgi:hypothetical protein
MNLEQKITTELLKIDHHVSDNVIPTLTKSLLDLSKEDTIAFGVWLTRNVTASHSKDGWWIYKDGWFTTDEVFVRYQDSQAE